MRSIIILFAVFFSGLLSAQVVTYYPQVDDFDREITLVFNLNLAKGPSVASLLGRSDDLYLWAGASESTQNPFQWQPDGQTNFNAPFQPGTLTSMGNNRWKITLTPRQYFRVPEGKKIAVLGLLLKNAAGTAQTENFILKPVVETALNEVQITVKKPAIEQMADRTVLNIDSDINAAGSTVFEVLQKAPGLSISGDDQLKMNGKDGLAVYIDGRPSQLSGRDLTAFLQSTPAGTIEKVEIYANPPARFDAQGNAGIINIKMKKGLNNGLNGGLYAAYTQNIHYRAQGGGNFNLRQGRTNIFGQWSGQNNYQHTFGTLKRTAAERFFDNSTTDRDKTVLSQSFRLGADWDLNKKNTVGILLNGRTNREQLLTPGQTLITRNGQLENRLETLNDTWWTQRFGNVNANFRHDNGKGNSVNIDADWTRFANTTDNLVSSLLFNAQAVQMTDERIQNDLATDIDVWTVRTDATWQIQPLKASFDAGAKAAFSGTANDLFASKSLENSAFSPDTSRSNQFDYMENIYAAYANFKQKTSDRWEWQAGLRSELTNANGISTDLRGQRIERPDTNYFSLFPSAFVQYTPAEKHGFKLAYTRRIGRPSYQDLNPFERIIDAYTSERGNPYLRPAFTHNAEFTYTYRQAASISIGANRTKDPLQWYAVQVGEKGYATTGNLGTQDNAYLNLNMPVPIRDWWFLYAYIGVYYNHYRATLPDGDFNGGQVGGNLYVNNNFSLKQGWKVQAEGWYNAPTRELVYASKGLGSINLGVQKTMLKDNLTLKITLYDLLNTQRWRQSADFGNQQFDIYRKWESRGIRLAVNYKFGNQNIKATRDRESGAAAEQDRIKEKTGGLK